MNGARTPGPAAFVDGFNVIRLLLVRGCSAIGVDIRLGRIVE